MTDNATDTGAFSGVNDDGLLAAIGAAIEDDAAPELTPDVEPEADDRTAPDAPASETESDNQDAADEPTFEVKIDGEIRRVTASELQANYQKTQAANKRFEEAAAMRKAIEAEAEQVRMERAQLAQALTQYQQRMQQAMREQQPDWDALIQQNPQEYLRQRHAWEARQAEMQQVQAAQAYLAQQQEAEQAQAREAWMESQRASLPELIPEWRNPDVAKAERAQIRDFLMEQGLTPDRLAGIDAQSVALARMAMKWQQLQKGQAPALQRAQKAPPRVEKPGVRSGQSDAVTAAKQRALRSGSMTDAAAAMAALLENSS